MNDAPVPTVGDLTFTPARGHARAATLPGAGPYTTLTFRVERRHADPEATTTFTFRVSDGTAGSDDAYTITVDVTPVNDAPTGADKKVTTAEDTPYTFSAADFAFTDVDEGDTLASVTVVTLPGAGTLARSGTPVTLSQSVAAGDLGNLTFTPATDASGAPYATFTFRVSDGDADSVPVYTMRVDVTTVNDAPTGADKTVTTAEDTPYTFSAADFAFTDVDAGDTLASVTVLTLPGAGTLAAGGHAGDAGPVGGDERHRQPDLHPGDGRERRPLCDLHLPGQRRRCGQCPGLHDDGRRDDGERRPDAGARA